MANPKGKLKMTGDTHLPDVESDDLDVEEGTATLAALAHERTQPGRPNIVRHAGMLRDHDDTVDAVESSEEPTRRPAMQGARGMQALAGADPIPWGSVALWGVGAWLLLKLLRR